MMKDPLKMVSDDRGELDENRLSHRSRFAE